MVVFCKLVIDISLKILLVRSLMMIVLKVMSFIFLSKTVKSIFVNIFTKYTFYFILPLVLQHLPKPPHTVLLSTLKCSVSL